MKEQIADPVNIREEIDRKWKAEMLNTILDTVLSYREKTVIEERFYKNKTLKESGEAIGVGYQRTSQIENKALRKLRSDKACKLFLSYEINSEKVSKILKQRKEAEENFKLLSEEAHKKAEIAYREKEEKKRSYRELINRDRLLEGKEDRDRLYQEWKDREVLRVLEKPETQAEKEKRIADHCLALEKIRHREDELRLYFEQRRKESEESDKAYVKYLNRREELRKQGISESEITWMLFNPSLGKT